MNPEQEKILFEQFIANPFYGEIMRLLDEQVEKNMKDAIVQTDEKEVVLCVTRARGFSDVRNSIRARINNIKQRISHDLQTSR